MRRVALRESSVVTLDANGAGTAKVGPLSARETWYPSNVQISCATKVIESKCDVYVGLDTSSSSFRDHSERGSSGESTGSCSADVLKSGMNVWAVWTGGDANTEATLTVTGLKDV